MPTTSTGLPYPASTDNNDSAAAFLALAADLNTDRGPFTTAQIGALAAEKKWVGRLVFNSTTKEFWFWDGSIWQIVGYVRGEIREWPSSAGSPPLGWAFAEGAAVSRTVTYDLLFAIYGTQFGAGDGSTTFNLPNKKGRASVGQDTAQAEFNVLGETGGAKTKTLGTTEIPSHTHTMSHGHSASAGNNNASHSHGVSINTDTEAAHNHGGFGGSLLYRWGSYFPDDANFFKVDAGTLHQFQSNALTGAAGAHSHLVSGSTGNQSANHGHTITVNSFSGNTGSAGSGAAFSIMNPYTVTRYIVKY